MHQDRAILDSRQPADAGADQNAGTIAVFLGPGLPAGIHHRLFGGGQAIDDEIIHAPLFLGINPLVGIEGPGRAVTMRNLASDLCRQILGLEFGDGTGAGLAGQKGGPAFLHTAG